MFRSNVASEHEFTVTISRIPTSDMVYATRQLPDGESELYVVMTDVIAGLAESANRLRVNAALTVQVNPSDPEVVVRARFLDEAQLRGAAAVSAKSAFSR